MSMNKHSEKYKLNYREILLRIIIIAAVILLFWFDILGNADFSLQDKLYQRMGVVSPDIYVIGIDEETLQKYGPFQSWTRDLAADMIEKLTENPDTAPAVIGMDIGFYGNRTDEEDQKLLEAVKNSGDTEIVLSSFASFGKSVVEGEKGFYLKDEVKTYEKPFEELLRFCKFGHTNVMPDEDGIVRMNLHKIEVDGKLTNDKEDFTSYSFAYEIYRAYMGKNISPPLDKNNEWYVAYSGEPMNYFGSEGGGSSFIRVLNGQYPTETFAGSIVMVGPYSAGMQDSYYTPVSKDIQMYGVEISANAVQALLDENFKREVTKVNNFLVLCAAMIFASVISRKLDFRIAGVIIASATAMIIVGCVWLYDNGLIFSLIYVIISIWVIYISQTFYNYIKERLERKKMMDVFSRYLSPQVAKNIELKGDNALILGGRRKHIAVLFVDIRSFTTISEGLQPEEVVEFLNHYLNLTTNSVFANEGTVDKFIGDATMAVFNAPFDLEDYVFKAVKTGLDMVEGAKKLEKEFTLNTGGKVGFGVGINCGDAIVGNIGTDFRMEYTAIGDTVNTASRLEGQAKAGEVIISQAVYEIVKNRVMTTDLGKRQLKGKADGFQIYRVDGLKEGSEEYED